MPPNVYTKDPSKWQVREALDQLSALALANIDDTLDWLYEVWPRLALRVVSDSGRLPPIGPEGGREVG